MTPEQLAEIERARHLLGNVRAAAAAADAVLLALQTSAAAAAPVPVPAPPAPVPVPPPPPASPIVGTIVRQPINAAMQVLFDGWSPEGSRYTRAQALVRKPAGPTTLRLIGYNTASGGTTRALTGTEYTVMANGRPVGGAKPAAGAAALDVPVDFTGVSGWQRLEVQGLGAGETAPVWFCHAGPAGAAEYIPVARGSYFLSQHGAEFNAYAYAPPRYAPAPIPLKPRQAAPFDTALARRDLHFCELVPRRFGDAHRPQRCADGLLHSFDQQSYHWWQMVSRKPAAPMLDGPRNVGTVAMCTHIQPGRDGKAYGTDTHRVFKVGADGTVTTLAGYRHKGVMSYYAEPADVELVGDWSAIPEDRRGFAELWGFAWDERTLTINEAAEPIPTEGNERPHLVGPVAFVADSQNNRVCKLQWLPDKHGAATVTEFLTGLGDPWDVACADGVLYVSERTSHRVAAYSVDTGKLLRVMAQGRALAAVGKGREAIRTAPLETCRAEPVVAPEGVFIMAGFLYFASRAQMQVRRMPLEGGAIEVRVNMVENGNTKFIKFAVSDGTAGPLHTVHTVDWSPVMFGAPSGWLPDGRPWAWGSQPEGTPAGWFKGHNYVSAVGCGNGRILYGGADEGLHVVTRRQPGDTEMTNAARRGFSKWEELGYELLHGSRGYGYYGLPLPWGEDPDIDAMLIAYGHTRPIN
jgi:hypothetical protein